MPNGTCANVAINCQRPAERRQFCHRCYKRFITGIPMDAPTRRMKNEPFERAVKVMPSGCHEWTGAISANGYGNYSIKGKFYVAHRWAYVAKHGPIPSDMVVAHLCDNPPCVNPDHLRLMTQKENIADMIAKGRQNFRGTR